MLFMSVNRMYNHIVENYLFYGITGRYNQRWLRAEQQYNRSAMEPLDTSMPPKRSSYEVPSNPEGTYFIQDPVQSIYFD
jgi:hypothetical protein